MGESIGVRVRRARERLGISQAELARRAKTSANAINLLEQGRTYDPRASRIIAVARELQVSADYILGLTDITGEHSMKKTCMLITLALLSLATVAAADVYKCPGAGGKPQYQNAPCDNAAPILETQPQAAQIAPAPARVVEPTAVVALPPPVVEAPEASTPPRSATSTPLDTNAFGMLTIGMSAATVRARVGEPDDITDRGFQVVGGIRRGRIAVKEVHTVTWAYFGDSQILDSFLTFADGVLVSKEKVSR